MRSEVFAFAALWVAALVLTARGIIRLAKRSQASREKRQQDRTNCGANKITWWG